MPGITIERPKMSVEMWEALKAHILKQREKRKQEQEQDAEQERHRREQELKRKRDAMTLEELKDQLAKLEVRLKELRDEKHQLFLQLKKVLNEDETRKRQRESELIAAHQAFALQTQQIQGANYHNSCCPPNTRIRHTTSNHFQLYYPPGTPHHVAYDAKGNPYHILPSGSPFRVASAQEAQIVEANSYDSNKYYHQFRNVNTMVPTGASSVIPIQPGQAKPGGITSGFPVQRLPNSTMANSPLQTRENREAQRPYGRYGY